MGLEYHAAKWLFPKLKENWKSNRPNKMLTLGRQHWWLTSKQSKSLGIKYSPLYSRQNFCDLAFEELGFKVESVDWSPNENPTYVLDLGKPNTTLFGYDIVLDLGTAEHIGSQQTFYENVFNMLSPTGVFIGISPSSGFCGHGLYQYSPDFFKRMGGYDSEVWLMTCGPKIKIKPYLGKIHYNNRWQVLAAYILKKNGTEFRMPVQPDSMVTTNYKMPLWLAKILRDLSLVDSIRRILT